MKWITSIVLALGLVGINAGGAQAFDWRDGNLTKKYWVENCQKQRLGLKGQELAQWRHWCHTIKPKGGK